MSASADQAASSSSADGERTPPRSPPSRSATASPAASPSKLRAAAPISVGAFNPAQLGLQLGTPGGNNGDGGGVEPLDPTAAYNASMLARSASPSSPSSRSGGLVRPLVSPSSSQPLPSFVYVPSNIRYFLVGVVQLFALWLLYTFTAYQIGVPWQVFLKLRHISAQTKQDVDLTPWQAATLFLWIMPAYAILFPVSVSVTILVKWVLIGRYQEGKHQLWGWFYLRWWFVQRITGLVPLVYLRGTVLMTLYARAMGARIGKGVFLNTYHLEAWDLIDVDDDASLGCDCHLSNFRVENGYLYISRIRIGKRAYVGTRSIIQGSLCNDAQVGAMSLLSHGKVVPENEAWRGAPAKKVGTCVNEYMHEDDEVDEESSASAAGAQRRYRSVDGGGAQSLNQGLMADGAASSSSASASSSSSASSPIQHFGRPSTLRLAVHGFIQFWFLCGVLSAIILLSACPGLLALHYVMTLPNSDLFPSLDHNKIWWQYVAVVPVMAVTFVCSFLLQVTILKNILMRSIKPGHYWIHSWWYLRKWMVDVLLQLSLHTVYTMYATMYLPPWLRTLGAKLGKGTEVSTAADYTPDLLEIGEGCFVADSVYLGVPTVFMGQVRMAQVKVGNMTFLGNGACLSLDASIGSDALVGVLSTPPAVKPVSKEAAKAPITWPEGRTEVADGTSYLGSPPMLLPRRQQAQGSFDVASTFQPTWTLYAQRLTWEFFRITLPFMFISALMLMYMGNFELMLFEDDATYGELALFWLLTWPACYVGAAFVCCFLVVAFKWVLVGTYTPSEYPLWSNFVWRTELCVGLMEALANPFFINHIRGTPFVCMWFRLLGTTVGERVFMDTTQITEPDLVHIGDDCSLQQDCTLQTHLFEDRIMKMSTLHLENFCSIGTMSVMLYDSRMKEGAHLGDLSLLMKGESLEPWTRSEGIPSVPIRHAAK